MNGKNFMVVSALLIAMAFVAGNITSSSGVPSAEEFYNTELAYMVSPTDLVGKMGANDTSFVILDARDAASYAKGHVLGAISIPYEEIDSRYQELPKDKEIIVYCWAHSCMLSRKAGLALAQHGITAKELNIGWNEWSQLQYPSAGSDVNWTYMFKTYCKPGTESC